LNSLQVIKGLNTKETPKRMSVSYNNVDTNFDTEQQQPNFCMGASNFDQNFILTMNSYPKSFK
jgi:hypothetical protein